MRGDAACQGIRVTRAPQSGSSLFDPGHHVFAFLAAVAPVSAIVEVDEPGVRLDEDQAHFLAAGSAERQRGRSRGNRIRFALVWHGSQSNDGQMIIPQWNIVSRVPDNASNRATAKQYGNDGEKAFRQSLRLTGSKRATRISLSARCTITPMSGSSRGCFTRRRARAGSLTDEAAN